MKTRHFPGTTLTLVTLLTATAAMAATDSAEAKPQTKTGFYCGTGANGIPFNDPTYVGQVYQQIYDANQFPPGNWDILKIAFTSNSTIGTGTFSVNVTIRMVATNEQTADPKVNLGTNSKIAYNGPRTVQLTGDTGDLDFPLVGPSGRPFTYNPADGNLLVQVRLRGTSGIGALFFCGTPTMWRVYEPLLTGGGLGPFQLDDDGLETVFTMVSHTE